MADEVVIHRLPMVRGAFVFVDQPRAFNQRKEPDDPDNPNKGKKFEFTALLSKKKPAHIKVYREIKADIERLWKTKWKTRPKNLETVFHGDGDERISGKTDEVYEGHKGMWWVKGKASKRPKLYAKGDDGELELIPPTHDWIQAGLYFNATMNLYLPKDPPDTKLKPMVCCAIRGLQPLGTGTAFEFGVTKKEFEDFDNDGEEAPDDDDEDDGLS